MKYYPLLQSQIGVFFDTIKYPNVMQYNLPSYACLGKDADPDKLEQTIMAIYSQRRELHLSFMIDEEGNPRQYFNPDIRFKVERKQMTEQECLDYIHNDFVRPFDIFGNECLFRSEIIETEKGYYLLFDMYHLVADGMSYTPIFTTQDFPKAFAGEDLGDMSYGMVEAALEEQESFGSEQYAKAKQAYAEKFSGLDFATLSPDRSNPVGKMVRERAYVPIADVDAWCKEKGVAVNLLFQAAFSYAVSVILGEKTMAYTTVSHGRNDKRLRSAYGMYVRSVPILSKIEPGMTVRDYIMSFRRELMSTIRNMVYPFNHLCTDLGMTPGITFNFQAIAGWDETLHIGDKAYQGFQPDRGDVFNDLSVFIFLYEDQYEIRLESSDATNSRATMRMLADTIRNAVINMMKDVDGLLDNVSVLSDEERRQIMEISTGKHIDLDITKTFAQAFIERAAENPDAPAVVDAWSQFTYGELDRNSDILANILVDNGVEPDSFVCVMLDRRKEFPLSVLAIHKAGAAYTPLDFEYPNERLCYMIENSQSKVLVTTHEVLAAKTKEGGLEIGDTHIIYLDDIDFSDAGLNAEPINLTTPKNLAYMIYTSGSTGKPKGTILHQEGLWNVIHVFMDMCGTQPTDRISGHRSFSFDAHIEDMYPVLTLGGSFHIIPSEIRKDLHAMYDFIKEHKITGGGYSTAITSLMINTFDDLPVRYISAGGEKLAGVYSDHVEIINPYGPTECTCAISYYNIKPGEHVENIPIGRPSPNGWIFIVSPLNGQLLPQGVPGELCFAGIQVGHGYWQLTERTAQSFCDCPYVERDAWGRKVRMYHTGDLCRWNKDGNLEFIGRIDFQVKLRGFRIELGEIETKALGIEGIRQAAAEVRKINANDHLLLYYTLEEGCSLSQEGVRKALEASSLAEYMVPDTYVEMDVMPVTPNGKINRRALPIPEIKSTIEYVEPANDTERAIASAIKDVLGVNVEVGALNNFFEFGGDSIKSIRLVSMLRQKGITLTVADVMKGKTVRGIAELAHTGEVMDISQEAVEGEIPTGAVMRYFFGMNLPHAEHYNQSVAFESKSRLNAESLKAALDAIAVHHDMLRLRAEDSRVYINNVSDLLYDFTEEDAANLTEVEAKSDVLQRSINLSAGLVLKAALFHLPENDVVVMICHHLAVDGVSWRIIAEDLNSGYQMAAEGKEIVLPKKTHSYKHYAEAILRYRDSYALSQEKTYWESVQAKMMALPQGGGNGTSGQIQKLHANYTNESVRHLLTDAHAAYGTNENDLLVAALVRCYRKLTGKSSASVLMEGHGREPIHEPLVTDRTVGWFTSTYPLVVENLNGDIRHDVRIVKETFRSVPNKGLGYGILQYIPSAEGDANLRTDLTALLGLNYLGELTEGGNDAVLDINMQIATGAMVNPEGIERPAFMIDCSVVGSTMQIEANYDSKVWTDVQADAMVKAFCAELDAIVAHTTAVTVPEKTASDLGATGWTDEQYQAITAEFSACGENIGRIYPLSPMQEGMLLEYMMNPGTAVYVLLNRFAMDVLPTEAQMRYALDKLAAKHEVFRSAMIYKGVDNPCQAITDRKPALKFVDISGEADIMAASKRVHEEELHAGFNLQSDPLLRAVVMKTGEKSCHLLLCTHHIIVDGWCLPIYLADFFSLLSEAMAGEVKAQPVLGDKGRYEEAVRNMLAMDKKASMRYWRDLIGDYSAKAIIPYDSDNVTESSDEVQSIALSPEFQGRLKAVGSAYGVTFNTLVELAWGLVLHTYNRNHDAVFGKVVSGRNHGDVTDLVGLFINTVPVRVRTDNETTVVEALQALQQQASDTTQHDYCALSEVQQLSELGNDLFQSNITFENYEGSDGLWEMAKKVGVTVLQADEVNYSELNLTVSPGEDGQLLVSFTYDGRLYSSDTIGHVKALFLHLLEEMAENADRKISELSLLDEKSKEQVLRMSEGKTTVFDQSKTFIEIFTQVAQQQPDAIAVADINSKYTYGELDSKGNALAHVLINKGVAENVFVCVLLERRKEFVLAVHGVHKAGAAYTPLDIDYPVDRIQYMLENSDSRVLVTTSDVLEGKLSAGLNIDASKVQIILLDKIELDKEDMSPICLTTPSHLAYMIYTSGSTGKPKGVMLHQRGLMNFTYSLSDAEQLTNADKVASHRSFSFDAHIGDLYPILYAGGELHIMPSEIRKDLDAMHKFLLDHQITGFGCTTSLMMLLINNYDLKLRFLTAGGEKLSGVKSDTITIINEYGPTECTNDSTIFVIKPGESFDNIPIGRPLPNVNCYVMDQNSNLLPQGIPGELCITGAQVGYGYWRLPEMTSKAFVENPFGEGKLYHTGDLVRYNKAGQIEYLGRIDGQVKLRGFRVELGEIVSQALSVDGIKQASAQVRKVNDVDHLVLYYTLTDGSTITEDAIDTALRNTSLAAYMIPEIYMQLDAMPLTPNGKVNSKALPMPEIKAEEIVAPETDTERKLWNTVSETLKITEFGVTTNLSHTGMTSLLAMRLAMAIQKDYDVQVQVSELIKDPTVRSIAAIIDKVKKQEEAAMSMFSKRKTTTASTEKKVDPFGAKKADPFAAKKADPFAAKKKNPFE